MSDNKKRKTRSALRSSPNELMSQLVSTLRPDDTDTVHPFRNPDIIAEPTTREMEPEEAAPEVAEAASDEEAADAPAKKSKAKPRGKSAEKPRARSSRPRRLIIHKQRAPEEPYRSHSITITDSMYDVIMDIRMSEMRRLRRSISIAEVMRQLMAIGIEETDGTKIFDD